MTATDFDLTSAHPHVRFCEPNCGGFAEGNYRKVINAFP
jgi:hypothetical protein